MIALQAENEGNISVYGAFEVNYGRVNTEYKYYYVISMLSIWAK